MGLKRIDLYRLSHLFLPLPFFLIPFLGGNHLSLYYVTIDKFWIESTFVLFLVFAVLFQSRNKNLFTGKTVLYFFIPFAIINLISVFYTWNIFSTMNEMNTLIWIAGSVYIFINAKKRDVFLYALVLGTVLSAICAIAQSKFLFPGLVETFKGGTHADMVRAQAIPFSSFLHYNVFGGFMCSVLPLAFYFGAVKKKWIYMPITALIIVGLIISTSRIAMGLSFLAAVYFVVSTLKNKDFKGVFSIVAVVLTGIAITFVLLQTGKAGDFRGLTGELEKKAHVTRSEVKTLNTRTEIWKNGFAAFRANPLTGYGAGAFEYGYRKYFDGGIYTKHAHTVILKYGVELGIMGLLCFLFYVTGFVYFLRKKIKTPEFQFIGVSIGCGFLFGVLDFSFDMPALVITFFVLTSVFFVDEKNKTTDETDKDFPVNADFKVRREHAGFGLRFKKRLIPSMLIVLLVCSLLFTNKAGLAGKSIENGILMEENGFFSNAYQSYRDAIRDMPANNEGYIRAAAVLRRLYMVEPDTKNKNSIKKALNACLEIINRKSDKDSQLYFANGLCYETLGENRAAEDFLLRAVSYYPSAAEYVSEIVRFYIKGGDLQKAKQWSHAIDPYLEKYKSAKNPKGFYVYRIKDMAAEIEYRLGNKRGALVIAEQNLHDAEEGRYVISDIKTGKVVPLEPFKNYLKGRADHFK